MAPPPAIYARLRVQTPSVSAAVPAVRSAMRVPADNRCLDAIPFHFVVEGLSGHSQLRGGLRQVSAALADGFYDEASLHLVEGLHVFFCLRFPAVSINAPPAITAANSHPAAFPLSPVAAALSALSFGLSVPAG